MIVDLPLAAHVQPNEFYQQIYEQAAPLLAKIISNHVDSDSINKVKDLNGEILEHNMKEGLPQE